MPWTNRALLQTASPAERPQLVVDLAGALLLTGRSSEAKSLLEKLADPGGELGARRLYYLVELSRPDVVTVGNYMTQLRTAAPESPWLGEALLSASNMYLLRDDFDTAARFLNELATRFPKGKHGPFASWRAAWLHFRLGDVEQAKQDFERHIALYPASEEAAGAMYWRGRMAQDEHDLATARAYFAKAADTYRNEYYGDLSRDRLRDLGVAGEKTQVALLDRVEDPKPSTHYSVTAPQDNVRAQKALLLENCGMVDFGVKELQAAGAEEGANWTLAQIAQVYTDSGLYFRSLQSLKRAVPGYYSFELSDLPRKFWEDLFPRPYWPDVKRYSAENGLDPFLVASLIRQESEFNPNAISHAQAIGLMQLLPRVGKKLAKDAHIRHYATSMLLNPGTNVQLGTKYLRGLLSKYDGRVEYALAAYNAGSERVDDWRKGKFRDVYEFVESIPFTETRGYVEAIVRNKELYQQLYGTP
jgi:soluble lytic murein transglycosylase